MRSSRNYFFSSLLVTKFVNSFIKHGKKEKFERILLKVFLFLNSTPLTQVKSTTKLPVLSLLYNAIEMHRPILGSRVIFKKRVPLQIPAVATSKFRYGVALRWIKESLLGFVSRGRRKKTLRGLRGELRNMEKKLKGKKYDLTDLEKEILSGQRIRNYLLSSISNYLPFWQKLLNWLYFITKDFQSTTGWRLKDSYHKILISNRIYSHYRWR